MVLGRAFLEHKPCVRHNYCTLIHRSVGSSGIPVIKKLRLREIGIVTKVTQ